MLDKLKKNKKWISIAILGLLILSAGIISIIAMLHKNPDYTFKEFIDNYKKTTSYESKDQNINFDGVLDEKVWEKQRWLDVKHTTENSIKVKMTSYFGEDGLYMAFDVDDLGIYYDKNKDVNNNSGVQLYLSSLDGAKNITGHGYEMTLNAGGKVDIKRFEDGAYRPFLGRVYSASTIKGELNTAEAKGYVMEVFVDYALLGGEPDGIYSNVAIVRSMSKEGGQRQWYSFGLVDRGASWTRAETWWSFDENGLVAYEVAKNHDSNGKIEGEDKVAHGDDYTFEIVPNEGYYANYILVNNKDVSNQLYYQNGKTYCMVEQVEGKLDIMANFVAVPTNTISVSGKISDGTSPISGVKAWAMINGYAKTLKVDAEGKYSDSIPNIEGINIFAQANGYVSSIVSAKEGVNDIVLNKMYVGDNTQVERVSSDLTYWDLTRLYEGRVRMKTSEFAMQLVNSEIYSNSVYASANIRTNAMEGEDTRAGFTFYVDSKTSVYIALTMNGEVNEWNPDGKISCSLQLISQQEGEYSWSMGGTTVSIENQAEVIGLATSEKGIPMSVHYCNGAFDVWVNGEKIGYEIYPTDKEGKNILKKDTKMAVGLECWTNKAVYTNLKFDGNYPIRTGFSAPGWDLTKVKQGIAKSLTDAGWTQAILMNDYAKKISISANVPLALQKGKDTRAGFFFKNEKGEDVFIALTMNGEKNDNNPNGNLHYTIQVISKGFSSWSMTGKITDISGWKQVKDAANSEVGVPMTVYVENGKFTIGINGYQVAENVYASDDKGKNVFAGDTALKAGLGTATAQTTYTNVSIGSTKPILHAAQTYGWDLSKLGQGEVIYKEKTGANIVLWSESRDKYYLTSDIVLPPTKEDTRAGYHFVDKNGNSVFVCLLCGADGKYSVQVITVAEGKMNWVWASQNLGSVCETDKAADKGLPFAVAYDNGALSIWVNNQAIGVDIVPMVDGKRFFASGTTVAAGLECWEAAGKFYHLEAYDTHNNDTTIGNYAN